MPRKCHSNKQLGHNTFNNNNNSNTHKINQHIELNLQLSVLMKKDQIAELLEACERRQNISTSHINIIYHTLTTLAMIKVTQVHLIQTILNANLISTRMR